MFLGQLLTEYRFGFEVLTSIVKNSSLFRDRLPEMSKEEKVYTCCADIILHRDYNYVKMLFISV
jgi:hypothetical protein